MGRARVTRALARSLSNDKESTSFNPARCVTAMRHIGDVVAQAPLEALSAVKTCGESLSKLLCSKDLTLSYHAAFVKITAVRPASGIILMESYMYSHSTMCMLAE